MSKQRHKKRRAKAKKSKALRALQAKQKAAAKVKVRQERPIFMSNPDLKTWASHCTVGAAFDPELIPGVGRRKPYDYGAMDTKFLAAAMAGMAIPAKEVVEGAKAAMATLAGMNAAVQTITGRFKPPPGGRFDYMFIDEQVDFKRHWTKKKVWLEKKRKSEPLRGWDEWPLGGPEG